MPFDEPPQPGAIDPRQAILEAHLQRKFGADPDLARRWAEGINRSGPGSPDWPLYEEAQRFHAAATAPPPPRPTVGGFYDWQPGEAIELDAQRRNQAAINVARQAELARAEAAQPLGPPATPAQLAAERARLQKDNAARGRPVRPQTLTHPGAIEYQKHLLALRGEPDTNPKSGTSGGVRGEEIQAP